MTVLREGEKKGIQSAIMRKEKPGDHRKVKRRRIGRMQIRQAGRGGPYEGRRVKIVRGNKRGETTVATGFVPLRTQKRKLDEKVKKQGG